MPCASSHVRISASNFYVCLPRNSVDAKKPRRGPSRGSGFKGEEWEGMKVERGILRLEDYHSGCRERGMDGTGGTTQT